MRVGEMGVKGDLYRYEMSSSIRGSCVVVHKGAVWRKMATYDEGVLN